MSDVRYEDEHVIRLAPGSEDIEIFHPESCERTTAYEGQVTWFTCGLGTVLREFGDTYLDDAEDGIYLARHWTTPPYWDWRRPSAVPIDADDGIELTLLREVPE
jgi:hypothetical protein